LWLRLVWLFLSAPLRARIVPPFGISRLTFRVWPHDLDTNLHMNNGRYLTIADQGRADLLLRTGLWRAVLKNGWLPMLSGASIRFRRELTPFQPFELQSRIVYWGAKTFVMEHRYVVTRNGEADLAAIALVKGGLYDRKARTFIEAGEIFKVVGFTGESPPPSDEVLAFITAEEALKRA
jgi:acyl-CoA thioesterase FadM